jgi:hypothetical protein
MQTFIYVPAGSFTNLSPQEKGTDELILPLPPSILLLLDNLILFPLPVSTFFMTWDEILKYKFPFHLLSSPCHPRKAYPPQ